MGRLHKAKEYVPAQIIYLIRTQSMSYVKMTEETLELRSDKRRREEREERKEREEREERSRDIMEHHVTSWNIMEHQGTSWNIMEHH